MRKSGIQKIKESNMDEKLKNIILESLRIIKELEEDIMRLEDKQLNDKEEKELQDLKCRQDELELTIRNIYLC